MYLEISAFDCSAWVVCVHLFALTCELILGICFGCSLLVGLWLFVVRLCWWLCLVLDCDLGFVELCGLRFVLEDCHAI